VAALLERGVDYLTPSEAEGLPISDETLILSLAAHEDARLRQALISLFLLQPQLGLLVPNLRRELEAKSEIELLAHYMAAVYLQRMWEIRLKHYGLPADGLPDYYSKELGLPHPSEAYGKAGLYALADWHATRAPHRANHLAEYQGVADLLFERLKLKAHRRDSSPGSKKPETRPGGI
jgi:hypothetical protein